MLRIKDWFNSFLSFEKREFDWWVYTLLPVIIFGLNLPFILNSIKDLKIISFMFAQLLYSYSFILASSDLMLKYKSKSIRKPSIGIPFLFMLILFISVAIGYNYQNKIITSVIPALFYLGVSILFTFISLIIYIKNPDTKATFGLDPKMIVDTKKKNEENFDKEFKSSKKQSKIDVKWGEK